MNKTRLVVSTAVADMCRLVPACALHNLYHRSLHGVSAPCIPQTLSRNASFYIRDSVQEGIISLHFKQQQKFSLNYEMQA